MSSSALLLVDAGINLVLGMLLLIFPRGLIDLLGIPVSDSKFYPSILGAVLFGIGIALLIERYKPHPRIVGLGLGGAVAINLCGGIVLSTWLIFGNLAISTVGYLFLGTLAVLLVGISAIEVRAQLSESSEAS
jgi:hypothetical protein